MSIKIDNSIPIPNSPTTRKKYPISEMLVGDSFFVPLTIESRNFASSVTTLGKRSGFKLTSRTVEENGVKGTRVWRIA